MMTLEIAGSSPRDQYGQRLLAMQGQDVPFYGAAHSALFQGYKIMLKLLSLKKNIPYTLENF